MDQYEYYSTNKDFEQFLIDNDFDFLINNEIKNDITINNKNKKLINHINNLHQLILNEISKNGIQNNKFLFKLRQEINNFQLDN